MAAQKRKSDLSAEKRPEKKQKAVEISSRPATHKSILRDEEQAFPRGGSSVLTPLEKRQIQIKAKQDVLFEQSTGKKATAEFDSEDDDDAIPEEQASSVAAASQKRKSRDKGSEKSKKSKTVVKESDIKIEGMSYKRLVPGTLLLGQVSAINKYDITVSLPNNLSGYVPLTAISDKVTQAVEALAAQDDIESDAGENEEPTELELSDYVRVGQYVKVHVTSVGDQEQGKQKQGNKRRIILSLVPEQTNSGMSRSDLVVNNVVQASVQSVEDHGLVMSLGVEDGSVKAFMGAKEIPANIKLSDVKPGAVMLCIITGLSSNGKVVKLSANSQKMGVAKGSGYLSDAPSVDSFQPGCLVEVLISSVLSNGVAVKIMGMLDATADAIHCDSYANKSAIEKRFPVGTKTKARVICNFPTSEQKKLGLSFLPHILGLSVQKASGSEQLPREALPISSVLDRVKVLAVEPGTGLITDTGVKGILAFVHISRLSDDRVATISADSGPYKLGSTHKARVLGYNPVDGLYNLSLEKSTIEAPYVHLEDVKPGDVVKATIEKLLTNTKGAASVILRLTNHIDGLVPELHLADVQLLNPEKKFSEGAKVTARVLSIDLGRRQMRLTLKKSLVNSDAPVWSSYSDLVIGSQAPGTIVKITNSGAVIQYYGDVLGFLPVREMSETFIKDPREHFRVGQVVNARILSVEPAARKMTLSCRDPSLFGPQQQQAYEALKCGSLVSGVVSEKTHDDIVIEIGDAKVKAMLPVDHLADGSVQKCQHAAKRIRVGQTLTDLLITEKSDSKHLVQVSNKPALLKAVKSNSFPDSISALQVGKEIVGFVRNVVDTAVYVQFAAGLVGLLPRKQLSDHALQLPSFGLRKFATITARVLSVDKDQERFVLTQKESSVSDTPKATDRLPIRNPVLDPVDESIESTADLSFGKIIKAKITAIKDSQLNVSIAEGIQGRVDVSQVFDSWHAIKDRKHPLSHFKTNSVISARIMGAHNHRNHKFLPLTHTGKAQVFELTMKKSDLEAKDLQIPAINQLHEGQEQICFVNNTTEDCLWVNLSPNIRGRIRAIDASDDTSILSALEANFPVGSAIRARILSVDVENNRLDLTARTGSKEAPKTLDDLSEGMILPGKVTRISERQVMVQLSDTLSGPVHLVEMADDFSKADPTQFEKNQIIRVHVTGIDIPNKKLTLSTRPSKVLSSSLVVVDKEIKSLNQVKINDVLRGFIKNVGDNGLFVALSSTITGFVRVSDLSDMFIKDWKSEFEVDQLVQGKVIAVDASSNHLQMSMKRSVIDDKNYKPPITYQSLKVGQTCVGKVRKVEDFGVFIALDNSANVSGLCHRSELADEPVANVKALYSEGDVVKVRVLKVDLAKRRVAFGLKASYFENAGLISNDSDDEMDQDSNSVNGSIEDSDDSLENGVSLAQDGSDSGSDDGGVQVDGRESSGPAQSNGQGLNNAGGLNVGAIDWSGLGDDDSGQESEAGFEQPKPKKRRKPEVQIDRTAELDVNGPQNAVDFERLLMGEPNSSLLWLSYMAHYLQLNEVSKAREIAERAIKTVNHQSRQTEEDAMNVWIGYLNLENTYGNDESVEEIFNRAVQFNDSEEIHSRLTSIYIQSEKHDKADALLQNMVKKFSQDPKVWLNYADFLFDTLGEPVRGRDLLPRALQALPTHHHVDLTMRFAQLEFKSAKGDAERGRTMFEGLMNTYPKRLDFYNVLLDLEQKSDDKDRVRRLFQRATSGKLKPKQAKYFFKRWMEYEQKEGDAKSMGKVKARAEEYVRKQSGEV